MGNTIGRGRKIATVMKIDGETLKLETPIRVAEVIKGHPGHVLIESEAVKELGIRAKPLEVQAELKPKRIYFLVELPKNLPPPPPEAPRRVRSAIQMSAKDRLESLMLSRRSSSDLSMMKTSNLVFDNEDNGGPLRVRMRLPKAQVEKLVAESENAKDATEKIVNLCLVQNGGAVDGGVTQQIKGKDVGELFMLQQQQSQLKPGLGNIKENLKPHEKRVGFMGIKE